jgi:hypothetical protein
MAADRALRIVDGLLTVVTAIIRAVKKGDTETVDRILGDDLETTIARARAEIAAMEKFNQ